MKIENSLSSKATSLHPDKCVSSGPRIVMIALSALLLSSCLFMTSGCASRYVVVTTNGTQITSKGKPKLVNGYYRFEDVLGQQMVLPSGRVREISPASMADDDDEGSIFTPQTRPVR
jgi:hypothetical protein